MTQASMPAQICREIFNIGLEKSRGTLRLRIVRQDTFSRDAAELIELSLIY